MTQRGGLPWNLVLGSPSPSNLPSMRIIWGTHPLQLHGPASHHPLIPQPPLRAGGGSSSLPLGPGPCSGPQTCLEPECPYVPLHSVCLLLEPGARETRPPGLSPQCHPACQMSWVWDPPQLCPWWCGLSFRGVLILGDTWQVKRKGGSRQVLALSKKLQQAHKRVQLVLGPLLAPLGDDGTTLSASIL